jgi:hypothetical protein
MEDVERPDRVQQAEVQGRQPRPVIDADEAAIGLPSFVTAPRRKNVEAEAGEESPAPSAESAEPAAPRRRGRPPGARNKPKAEAGAE